MAKSISGFRLSFDAADEITLANLKESRKLIKKEMKRWGEQGHADDYANNVIFLKSLKVLIKYYRK
jgi:hypothetical protein